MLLLGVWLRWRLPFWSRRAHFGLPLSHALDKLLFQEALDPLSSECVYTYVSAGLHSCTHTCVYPFVCTCMLMPVGLCMWVSVCTHVCVRA